MAASAESEEPTMIRNYWTAPIEVAGAPDELLQLICRYFKVEISAIKGKSRKAPLPDIRHLYCYIAVQMFKQYSLKNIGDVIFRDHATVIHGIRKYQNDFSFKAIVDDFIEKTGIIN